MNSQFCTHTSKLQISRLKGIQGLQEISFEDNPVTGIFGPNGAGKSTILHALAAAYRPENTSTRTEYNRFFPRLENDIWNGTEFTITHDFATSQQSGITGGEVTYRKGTATTRWNPLQNNRPKRKIEYIGVKSCIPILERYPSHDLLGSSYSPDADNISNRALSETGRILNIPYDSIHRVTQSRHTNRDYYAFHCTDGIQYDNVTMGAGEQRLFEILKVIERAGEYALFLIDEIDLLLHGDALNRLIDYLYDHCGNRQQQVVFTSHREELLRRHDKVNIRHIHHQKVDGATYHVCFNDTNPDSQRRLTGQQTKKLEVFVEDSLGEAVIQHLTAELGISKHVKVTHFGAIYNCFPVLSGLLISGQNCDDSLFLLDGDELGSEDEKQERINKACTGNSHMERTVRNQMLGHINEFTLPQNTNPEQFLHGLITDPSIPQNLGHKAQEIIELANEIVNPTDTHHFIDGIVEVLGIDREVALERIVEIASHHSNWDDYVATPKGWLAQKKTEHSL